MPDIASALARYPEIPKNEMRCVKNTNHRFYWQLIFLEKCIMGDAGCQTAGSSLQ